MRPCLIQRAHPVKTAYILIQRVIGFKSHPLWTLIRIEEIVTEDFIKKRLVSNLCISRVPTFCPDDYGVKLLQRLSGAYSLMFLQVILLLLFLWIGSLRAYSFMDSLMLLVFHSSLNMICDVFGGPDHIWKMPCDFVILIVFCDLPVENDYIYYQVLSSG